MSPSGKRAGWQRGMQSPASWCGRPRATPPENQGEVPRGGRGHHRTRKLHSWAWPRVDAHSRGKVAAHCPSALRDPPAKPGSAQLLNLEGKERQGAHQAANPEVGSKKKQSSKSMGQRATCVLSREHRPTGGPDACGSGLRTLWTDSTPQNCAL